ncbi:MAG: DNA repair protein RecN, partial [Desulfovibrio sp.]|nr:DNA repair protein RecN [Desulfovibrio sp.]
KNRQADLAEKRELLEMQKEEINKVNPAPGEEEELEEQRAEIKKQEDARKVYDEAMAILHGDDGPGLLQMLADLGSVIRRMDEDDPEMVNIQETVDAFRDEMAHLGNNLRRPRVSSDADLDDIEERLFEFAQLKRKLKRAMPQILELKNEIEENLSFLDACALDIAFNTKERNKLAKELGELVIEIIPLRHEAAAKFATELEEQLRELGFSEHVKVAPEFLPNEIWPGVNDEKGRIFWAPNPGQKSQPLDKIASGGELSRFLLGLNILGEQNREITFIFDEVDAGVGGLTLNKVLEKLQTLAKSQQVILITHWPQLAARANRHFQITKTVKDGNTYTQCSALDETGRFKEIERMAGGGKEGEAMAKNLLDKTSTAN